MVPAGKVPRYQRNLPVCLSVQLELLSLPVFLGQECSAIDDKSFSPRCSAEDWFSRSRP
jgi:hypothetical protein